MSILDRLKKNTAEKAAPKKAKRATKAKAETAKPSAKKAATLHHAVLRRPVITEKATLTGTVIFEVAPTANKVTVQSAIREQYGVTPLHVRILNVKGKAVRWGSREGKRKDWKKAIIRLRKGETINVYEGT